MTMDWTRYHSYKVYPNGRVTDLYDRDISTHTGNDGYIRIQLRYDGERHSILLHRLIAEVYIPNPAGFSVVHHIDGNKQNNNVSNLAWSTQRGNMISCAIERGVCKMVMRTSKDGEVTKFHSIMEASRRMGVSTSSIRRYLVGCKPKDGSTWRLIDEESNSET